MGSSFVYFLYAHEGCIPISGKFYLFVFCIRTKVVNFQGNSTCLFFVYVQRLFISATFSRVWEFFSGYDEIFPVCFLRVHKGCLFPVRELITKRGSTVKHLCGLWRVYSGWIRRDLFALRRGVRSRLACCRPWSVGLPLAV